MYLLPNIHRRLYDVPGRPDIQNCGEPTEKPSEFLDTYPKENMENGWIYSGGKLRSPTVSLHVLIMSRTRFRLNLHSLGI